MKEAKAFEMKQSYSAPDILQDLWVMSQLEGKRNGYFVEVGASDGVGASNTLLMEKHYGWAGICIEPNTDFYEKLVKNRKCICDSSCIAGERKRVNFRVAGYYSGIEEELKEWHRSEWDGGKTISRVCKLLSDVLDQYGAPSTIDYISIDIEGGEEKVIETFPFDRYQVLTMTIERSDASLDEIVRSKGFEIVKNPLMAPEVDWELHCVNRTLLGE
jgi:FkbM family methyltransferase